MNNILTVNELKELKDLGGKIDENKIKQVLNETQITNLKEILGSNFYFDVLNNLQNPIFQDLLSGCTFNYNNVVYYQNGLKSLLADYFMSKYILIINTNFTPFGATVKQSPDSVAVDRNTLKDISTQQLQIAGAKWETIKLYLNNNTSIFKNWSENNGLELTKQQFRIRKI